MKRHEYTEKALRMWTEEDEEKVYIRIQYGPQTEDGGNLLKIGFDQFHLQCGLCRKPVPLEEAIMENKEAVYNLEEYGTRIGRNSDNEVHADADLTIYCSESHAVAGEL